MYAQLIKLGYNSKLFEVNIRGWEYKRENLIEYKEKETESNFDKSKFHFKMQFNFKYINYI